MNEYDSAKMADVLEVEDGYEKTSDPAQADLILFNTCSVREKAQEKVFSDLGRVRHLKRDKPDLIIMPASFYGKAEVMYRLDINGQLSAIWLLTREEAALHPKPAAPRTPEDAAGR